MVLHISPDRTISELQNDFSEAFPGLKLVFFTKPHHAHKGSAAKFLVQDREATLGSLSSHLKTGYLLIEHDMVVWQLERLFETEYALHVQVFRKSGRTWLETSRTDDLTIEQQQAKAKISEQIHQEFVDPMDYRDQD